MMFWLVPFVFYRLDDDSPVFALQDYDGEQRSKQMDKGLISILGKELRKVIQSLDDPKLSDKCNAEAEP
jgi:hypothetical protein